MRKSYKKYYFFSIGIILQISVILVVIEFFFMLYPSHSIKKWNYSEEEAGKTKFHGLELEGQFNSMGLRDKEYSFDHEHYRVLALGDSFTYGLWLKNSNSWPKKAEQYLHNNGYNAVKILNGGIPGLDTKKEYEFFRNYSYRYKPNMVIIGFLINDASYLCSNYEAVDLKKKLDSFWKNAKNRCGLYTLNYIRFAYLKYKLTKATIKEYSDPYDRESASFQQCKKAFLDFKELSKNNNFELVVVIYPMLVQLNKNYPFNNIHKKMEKFFKEAEIEAYDLTPAFYGYPDTDLWISDQDSHPNKKANEIAAKRIVTIITKHYNKAKLLDINNR